MAKPLIPPVAAGRVLVRKDVYDIPSDNKEGANNESLAFSERATAKARGGEKRKRSNIGVLRLRDVTGGGTSRGHVVDPIEPWSGLNGPRDSRDSKGLQANEGSI